MGTGRVAPWVVIVVALASTGAARAQDPESELGGYVTLSTGYWKHGLSQIDGPSLQLGIDYSSGGDEDALFVGRSVDITDDIIKALGDR